MTDRQKTRAWRTGRKHVAQYVCCVSFIKCVARMLPIRYLRDMLVTFDTRCSPTTRGHMRFQHQGTARSNV